ncbi:hypothetical protein DKX38_008426 [Salix brachista]|uniref:RING-type domain-containing protein n=1 Tax=Salix brachista TaxID=2182728 RepID=A0A5N5MR84_9ROSI|nr:hypothetical protein DKX38_008426 [Salix brachista]
MGNQNRQHQVVKVRRETIEACMTCPLCNKLLRDATTISECLHTCQSLLYPFDCSIALIWVVTGFIWVCYLGFVFALTRKCIYKRISDEGLDSCPICNINLGCIPLEKLRPDHNLQDVRSKIFPYKRRKVEAPEVVESVTLPVIRRKERSLSSLVVSTPKVSTQTTATGRRTKPFPRKAAALRGSSFSIEKPIKKEHDRVEDSPQSSSSPETPKKFNQNTRQNSSSAEPSQHAPDDEAENGGKPRDGKSDLWQPLNFLVEVANRTKSFKSIPSIPQVNDAKLESRPVCDNEPQVHKTKLKENRDKSKVKVEKNNIDNVPEGPVEPKRLRRIRRKKAASNDISGISSPAVLHTAAAKQERRNGPVWFSLLASEEQEGDAPLPQIPSSYLRLNHPFSVTPPIPAKGLEVAVWKVQSRKTCISIQFRECISRHLLPVPKWTAEPGHYAGLLSVLTSRRDGNVPVSFIQKYLMKKLDLNSEAEVEIRCMGRPVIPTLLLCNLVDQWLQTAPKPEQVPVSAGCSAKDFVMVLAYARKVPNP